MKAPEKFPLSWPAGYPVTKQRQHSKFDCTMAEARDGVMTELNRLGATEALISTNVQVDRGGIVPAAGRLVYDNPGVAVYFKFKGELKVVACDKWVYLHENMRAVQKSIEAIRGLERWGCSDIISRAMGDMKALPQQGGSSNGAWWIMLEVEQNATKEQIEKAYKKLAKVLHPDKASGSDTSFNLLNQAYKEAIATIS